MALRRYLVIEQETETAYMPDWYPLIQAAKYLGVAPWELLEQPIWWRDKALIALSAESEAAKIREQKQ